MPSNILNQPIQFNLDDKLLQEEHYSQPITSTDKINFQILLDVDDTDLVTDGIGNYTQDPVSQWTSSSGLYKQLGNEGELYQDVFTANKYYQVKFTVLTLNNAGSLDVYIGTNLVETIDREGDFIVYGQATGNTRLTFDANDVTEVRIEDSVEAYLVENGFEVIETDKNGLFQQSLQATEDTVVRRNALYQNISVPDSECFKLKIIDLGTTEVVDDHDFDSGTPWTIVGDLTVTGGVLRASNIRTGINLHQASQVISPVSDTLVQVTSTIDDIEDIEVRFRVIHVGSGEVLISQSEIADGDLDLGKLQLQGGEDYRIELEMIPANDTNSADVRYFSMVAYNEHLTSNLFKLIEETEGTLKLTGENNNFAYGFSFDNDFVFELRIEGAVQHPTYETEAEFYKGSDGNRFLYYSDDNEVWRLVTKLTPIYIHRALRKMLLMNTLKIDTKEYVSFEESFEVSWPNDGGLAPAETVIVEKTQNYFNRI